MKYDAVILGGGPAAVSAALTLRARGKTAAIISGGIDDIPLSRAHAVANYPGRRKMPVRTSSAAG